MESMYLKRIAGLWYKGKLLFANAVSQNNWLALLPE